MTFFCVRYRHCIFSEIAFCEYGLISYVFMVHQHVSDVQMDHIHHLSIFHELFSGYQDFGLSTITMGVYWLMGYPPPADISQIRWPSRCPSPTSLDSKAKLLAMLMSTDWGRAVLRTSYKWCMYKNSRYIPLYFFWSALWDNVAASSMNSKDGRPRNCTGPTIIRSSPGRWTHQSDVTMDVQRLKNSVSITIDTEAGWHEHQEQIAGT